MEAGNSPATEAIVYELWSEDDLAWIEITCPSIELAAFLEAWCEKNASIFRRRPFGGEPARLRRAARVRIRMPAGDRHA